MMTYPISSNLCKNISLHCYRLHNFLSFSSSHWRFSVRKGKVSFLIKLQLQAEGLLLVFLVPFSWKFLVYIPFQQKNEMKKGKYHDGVQIFTFLLEYRFVWRQRFQKKFDRRQFHQKMCLKRIWCCSFHG